jgi:hypothetical protein
MSFGMEPSTADKDLTATNTHSGEEQVSENPLDNATEINENGQNVAYSENIIIEPDVDAGGTSTESKLPQVAIDLACAQTQRSLI